MRLFGKFDYYGSVEEIQRQLGRNSLYKEGEKVIVFDLDEVLILRKPEYKHGKKNGQSNEVLHHQASRVITRALNEIGNVVLWTAAGLEANTNGRARILTTAPFTDVQQHIAGASMRFYSSIKYLRLITPNLDDVVAIEDGISTFVPKRRVVKVEPHDDLYKKYCIARDYLLQGKVPN